MSVIIGVDPHKASHTAVALDDRRKTLGQREYAPARTRPRSC